MGIDRLGKGGIGPVPPSTVAPPHLERTPSPRGVGRPFDPGSSASVEGSSPVEAAGAGELEQLRSGRITLDRYLDAKVDEATAQLALPPVELGAVRTALRERLASDPTLVDLVRAATGAVVSPPHDD